MQNNLVLANRQMVVYLEYEKYKNYIIEYIRFSCKLSQCVHFIDDGGWWELGSSFGCSVCLGSFNSMDNNRHSIHTN